MRTGENNRTITELEKAAGQRASRTIRKDLRAVLGTLNISQGSTLLRSLRVTPVMKFDALDRVTIKTRDYIFKQHYGFEGIKSNGVAMSLKSYDHFGKLFDKTNALERLADEIAALRTEEVIAKIKF